MHASPSLRWVWQGWRRYKSDGRVQWKKIIIIPASVTQPTLVDWDDLNHTFVQQATHRLVAGSYGSHRSSTSTHVTVTITSSSSTGTTTTLKSGSFTSTTRTSTSNLGLLDPMHCSFPTFSRSKDGIGPSILF